MKAPEDISKRSSMEDIMAFIGETAFMFLRVNERATEEDLEAFVADMSYASLRWVNDRFELGIRP